MDGIVRMRTIAFTPDRMPTLRRIKLGFEGDNLVERLEFDLPEIAQGQTATLMITGADAVTLDRTDEGRYAVDLTREMIGPDGEREAYIRIDGACEKVWQSAVMRMVTGELPDVETEIEKVYPTAVGQILTAMAEHSSEMDAQEERVEQAAQRAEEAAERAEAGGGGTGGGGAVEIDTTLTQAGKAADAKATGEAIGKLSKEIENMNVGGLGGDAKNIIFTLLKNATYTNDVSAEIAALAELWEQEIADDLDISNVIYINTSVSSNRLTPIASIGTGRLTAVMTEGEIPLVDANNEFEGEHYLIPVPPTANGIVVTTPDLTCGIQLFTNVSGAYNRLVDSGWLSNYGENTYRFAAGTYDYIAINFKYKTSGSLTNYDTSKITMKFIAEEV